MTDACSWMASPRQRSRTNGTLPSTSSNLAEERQVLRVLIVEDDFLVASDVEAGLQAAGYDVIGIAARASEALKLAASEKPSLAIMDIRLAGKRDGIDTALELYRSHRLRCIFATAHSDDEARSRGALANPLGWIQKPYSIASLCALIDQVRTSCN
jgi:two-component system, response regulator PdtaR